MHRMIVLMGIYKDIVSRCCRRYRPHWGNMHITGSYRSDLQYSDKKGQTSKLYMKKFYSL